MLIAGIILSIALLLGFTRVGFRAARTPDGETRVILRAGVFRIDLMKLLAKGKRKGRKEKPEKAREEETRFTRERLSMMRGAAMPVLRSLRRGVRIDRLHLRLTVAGGDDPCGAAILYGRLHMAWGMLRPLLEENLRVRKRRVEIGLDFDLASIRWDGDVAVTISVGRSLAALLAALGAALRQRGNSIPRKAV